MYSLSESPGMAGKRSDQVTSVQDSAMYRAFSTIDRDENGAISFREVKDAFEALGLGAKDHDIKTSIQKVGTPGTGVIKMEEFISAFAPAMSRKPSDHEIHQLFMVFDKDKDGVIGIDDLRFVLEMTGRLYSIEELNAMMKELDVGGDGVVTYSNFCKFMKYIY